MKLILREDRNVSSPRSISRALPLLLFITLSAFGCSPRNSEQNQGDQNAYHSEQAKVAEACFNKNNILSECPVGFYRKLRRIHSEFRLINANSRRVEFEIDAFDAKTQTGGKLRIFAREGDLHERWPLSVFKDVDFEEQSAKYVDEIAAFPNVQSFIKFSDGTKYPGTHIDPQKEALQYRIRYIDPENMIYCHSFGGNRIHCYWQGEGLVFHTNFVRFEREKYEYTLSNFRSFVQNESSDDN